MSKSDNVGWDPIPQEGTVTWRVAQPLRTRPPHPLQTQKMRIAGEIADIEHFTGTIWFKYVGGKWEVYPISTAEEVRRRKARQSTP